MPKIHSRNALLGPLNDVSFFLVSHFRPLSKPWWDVSIQLDFNSGDLWPQSHPLVVPRLNREISFHIWKWWMSLCHATLASILSLRCTRNDDHTTKIHTSFADHGWAENDVIATSCRVGECAIRPHMDYRGSIANLQASQPTSHHGGKKAEEAELARIDLWSCGSPLCDNQSSLTFDSVHNVSQVVRT